jgi:hypothetical protein
MALPSGTGDSTSNEAGIAVYGTPVYEPHPTKPGVWRVKMENGEPVYTPESIARFRQVQAARDPVRGQLGKDVTDDPVALYYAKEKEYQDHPERARPPKGPHSSRMEIPPQYLEPPPASDPPPSSWEPVPILAAAEGRDPNGRFRKRE